MRGEKLSDNVESSIWSFGNDGGHRQEDQLLEEKKTGWGTAEQFQMKN